MNGQQRAALESEIATLEALLDKTPRDRAIHRKGFQARLKSARALLEDLPEGAGTPSGTLMFYGEPVVDRRGIYASFAGRATDAFSEAVAAIAEALSGNLGDMGPIARGDRSKLLLTEAKTGSFGFTFEAPEEESLPGHDAPSSAAIAVAKLQELFEEAAGGENETLADLVAEMHQRALKKVRDFLGVLHDQGAWCAMAYQGRQFRFRDIEDLRRVRDLLDENNIVECEESREGVIEGLLPTARQMEFRIEDEAAPVRVRIGREVDDMAALKALLDQPVRAKLRATRIANRRPRHELIAMPEPLAKGHAG